MDCYVHNTGGIGRSVRTHKRGKVTHKSWVAVRVAVSVATSKYWYYYIFSTLATVATQKIVCTYREGSVEKVKENG